MLAMAETYSATIAETIAGQKRLDRQEILEIWHDARPILLTANLPTLVFLLSEAGLYSMDTALIIAKSAIYLALFAYGLQDWPSPTCVKMANLVEWAFHHGHRSLDWIDEVLITLMFHFWLPILAWESICLNDSLEPPAALLDCTLKSVVIDMYQTESWGISERPFKIIQERPVKISFHGYTALHG